MAVLGLYVDRVPSQTLVGAAWGGATNVTLPHSLATTPDYAFPIPISIQTATAMPCLGALRGNASLNTMQVIMPSVVAASAPTMAFDFISIAVWSGAR